MHAKISFLFFALATLILTSFSSLPVHADIFANSSSKHRCPKASPTWVDYAKFEWLVSDDVPSTATVNRIVVSLSDQRLYAFHGQVLLAWSNVCSGRAGHETPTGVFAVSEKDANHHSSLYEDASMPFFMRLTDTGVGLHAGFLPGYPASHGCVRLPFGMASELFQRVESGTPVTIVTDSQHLAVADGEPTVRLAQN